jgi:hypothetical protein
MFNLFGSNKNEQEIIDDALGTNPFGWQYVPIETAEYFKGESEKFYKENRELKDEILEYKKGNKNWMNLYQEVVDKNNELLKEVINLRHLKEENVRLIEEIAKLKNHIVNNTVEKEPKPYHSSYPIHWGGWTREEEEWKCPCNICKKNNLESRREWDNL